MRLFHKPGQLGNRQDLRPKSMCIMTSVAASLQYVAVKILLCHLQVCTKPVTRPQMPLRLSALPRTVVSSQERLLTNRKLTQYTATDDTPLSPSHVDLETFAMSNVPPKRTGLPMVVYIGPKNAKHGCRLKVSQFYGTKMRVGQWFFMTVEHEPHIIGDTGGIKLKDIKLVQDFIIINIRVILDFWEQSSLSDVLTHHERSVTACTWLYITTIQLQRTTMRKLMQGIIAL